MSLQNSPPSEQSSDDENVSHPLETEAQTSCPVCGAVERALIYAGLRDTLFGAPGTWSMHGCDRCGCLFLDPRPTRRSIVQAYRTYYTHVQCSIPDGHDEGRSTTAVSAQLKDRLRNGYLSARYGFPLEPAWRWAGRLVPLLFPRHRLAFDTLVRHLPYPHAGARLLDVGCGSGDFLVTARALGWNALGLEMDPVSCATVRSRGAEVLQTSLEEADLAPESFDAVTMNHVLEHLHDPVAGLAEVVRLLKPGGCAWIATPNADSPLHRRCGSTWRGLEPPRHLVLFSRNALTIVLRRAGLSELRWPRAYPLTRWMARSDPELASAVSRYELQLLEVASVLASRWNEQLVVLARKQ